jgi:hypothetical protein
MRWLVKIGFPYHILTVRPGLGPYVRRVTTSHTSSKIPYIRYVGSQREPHFLSTIRLFFDSYGY